LRQRSYFDQIHTGFFRQMQCLPDADDPQRLPLDADQADFGGVDLFVDAMRLLQCDGWAPFSIKN
jgi:hypothetical protein